MDAPPALPRRVFQGEKPGPRLLVTGGVHGDEFEPMEAIRRLAGRLDRDPALLASLSGTLTLVPAVNEAAFLRGHRCAEDGLDLARTCPGRADGSVTERIAWQLSALIRDSDFYLDLHTGGTEMAVLPLAGYVLHPDATVLERQRRMARAFGLPVIWGTSAALEGRSLSVARDAGVPAIYAEYLGSATCSEEGIRAYVEGCLGVMAELGMLAGREAPETSAPRVIEDPAPGSGHMQAQNPSPADGYFEAAVALGDAVEGGQLLGTVSDPLGEEIREIRAAGSGLVLVLRTFPRVRAGEMVAVVAGAGEG